jgi:hypothetical protein
MTVTGDPAGTGPLWCGVDAALRTGVGEMILGRKGYAILFFKKLLFLEKQES